MEKIWKSKKILSIMIVCLISVSASLPAFAYSSSSEANLPNSNWKIQSNVWQSGRGVFWTQRFVVSAKLLNRHTDDPVMADRIRTTWLFSATGIGVSIRNVSTGNMCGSTFSGYWENTNSWISDMSGTFRLSGLPLWSTFNNTAFALKSGVKATTSTSVFRFY